MTNSSGGQQEVAQQEEVGEEEGEEQEFEQQEEEQMVVRRIAVSRRRPIKRGVKFAPSVLLHSRFVSKPVKEYTIRLASEKRMLRQVAFTEKVISTSLGES